MTTEQDAVAVMAPIEPGRIEKLRALLERIGDEVEQNTLLPFAQLTTVHFARLLILPETHDAHGNLVVPSLLLVSYFDAPLDGHLEELVRVAGPGLHELYAHCKEYPAAGQRTPQNLLAYLRQHTVANAAVYVGARGHSVKQAHEEAQLREAIETFVDRRSTELRSAEKPQDVRRAIQAFVETTPSLGWALSPAPSAGLRWKIRHYARLVAFVACAAAVLFGPPAIVASLIQLPLGLPGWTWPAMFFPLSMIAPLTWLVLLRINEKREAARSTDDDNSHISEVVEYEDRVGQNPMTWVISVKPGRFRLFTLKLVMRLTDLGTHYVFTRGELLDIPTVHFASWNIVDGNRRLLFLSNFDGSWENYVGDFVDKAAWGLTAIWSNTVGFASTRWLILGGARSERHFKGTHRDNEPPTQVFYSAYKQLSLSNLNNNARIRAGLFGHLDKAATRRWLQLF